MKKKIFIVTYGGGHANIVRALYNAMNDEQKSEVQILGLTMADGILTKAGIPHKTINDYMGLFPYRKRAEEIGRRFLSDGNSEEIRTEDTVAYYGLNYYELEKKYGEREAANIFLKKGRAAFLPVETLKTILKYENPDVLVVTNSPRMERAAAIAANLMNIPVVRINDMPKMTESIPYKATLCVMNRWAQEDIAKNEFAEGSSVEITGQPVFENNLVIESDKKKKYFNYIHDKFDKCIIYLGQGEPENIEAAIPTVKRLKELSEKYNRYCFVVRPHPNAEGSYGCDNTENFIITKEGELKYLLSECDLAITHYSTSGMEAALLGKPVMTVFSNDYAEESSLFESWGIATSVADISDIEKTMLLLLNKESKLYKELELSRSLFENKKDAANNIIKVIYDVIKDRR